MPDPTEALQKSLAKERFARSLIERGVKSEAADRIAGNANYSVRNDDVVIEFAGAQAITSFPQTVAAMAAQVVDGLSIDQLTKDDNGFADAAARGKASAAAVIKQRDETNRLAFK